MSGTHDFTFLRVVSCVPGDVGFTVLPMTQKPRDAETRPGALLVRQRWDRPEHVAKRVERLASEIAKLPTLTREQRAQLTAAIKANSQ